MYYKNLIIYLALVALLPFWAAGPVMGQEAPGIDRIRGTVVDSSSGRPLSLITVRLVAGKDSTVAVVATRADGVFLFEGVKQRAYSVDLSAVGYSSRRIAIHLREDSMGPVDLGRIYLDTLTTSMQAAVVTASRPIVKQLVDRIVYDLQADPDSKVNSVLEMMRKVPFLSVDAAGTVLLKGNASYKLFINGKPSGMVERNPTEFLRNLPATSIQSIEVITNPPAKYDAEGLAGIINIVLKKKIGNGYSGSLTMTESFPSGGPSFGGSFAAKHDKFEISAFGGGNLNRTPSTTAAFDRSTTGADVTDLSQQSTSSSNGRSGYIGVQLSQEIDSLRLLTGQFDMDGSSSTSHSAMYSLLTDPSAGLQGYELGSHAHYGGHGLDASVNYQLGFRNDRSRFLTFSYRYLEYNNNHFDNLTVSNEEAVSMPDYQQNNVEFAREHTIQADYSQTVHKIDIEAGVKAIFRDNKSHFNDLNFDSTEALFKLDSGLSDSYTNTQDVVGAYNSYHFGIKHWDFMAGVRAERTFFHADFISMASTVVQNYFNVIPSVGINRSFDDGSSLNLGFNQRIKRPNIIRLNPFVDRSNPDAETTGNPDLRPVVINNLQLAYSRSKKASINLSLSYFFSNSIDLPVTVFLPGGNITYTTYENVGKASRLGLDYNFSYPLTKRLNFSVNGNVANLRLSGIIDTEAVKVSKITYYAFGSLNYRFGKSWEAGVSLSITSKGPSDLQATTNQIVSSAFSISKDVVGDKLSLSASVSNPFAKYRHNIIETVGPDFSQVSDVREYFRLYKFSVNYRFGKLRSDTKRTRATIRNDDTGR